MNFVVQYLNFGANKWCTLLRGSECATFSMHDASILAGATLGACFGALVVVAIVLAAIRREA